MESGSQILSEIEIFVIFSSSEAIFIKFITWEILSFISFQIILNLIKSQSLLKFPPYSQINLTKALSGDLSGPKSEFSFFKKSCIFSFCSNNVLSCFAYLSISTRWFILELKNFKIFTKCWILSNSFELKLFIFSGKILLSISIFK